MEKTQKGASKNPSWKRISESFINYEGATWTTIYNYLVFFGGSSKTEDGPTNSLFVFDLTSYQWINIESLEQQPSERIWHTACLTDDNRIVFYGGVQKNMENCKDLAVLEVIKTNPLCLGWEHNPKFKSQDIPKRFFHTSDILENKMYVFGGRDADYNATNTLFVLNTNDFSWEIPNTTGNPPGKLNSNKSKIG